VGVVSYCVSYAFQVVVCSGGKEETTKTLLEVIDEENLPEEYGGSCSCEGGCIPAGGEYEPYRYREDGSPINPTSVDVGRRCTSHHTTPLHTTPPLLLSPLLLCSIS